jgi:hypothetical protein
MTKGKSNLWVFNIFLRLQHKVLTPKGPYVPGVAKPDLGSVT